MTGLDIAHQRLYNQHIARATFEKPIDVVEWLGAVQAQDYLGALWAIGLRMGNAAKKDIKQAIADKTISLDLNFYVASVTGSAASGVFQLGIGTDAMPYGGIVGGYIASNLTGFGGFYLGT